MANEISVQCSFTLRKGALNETENSSFRDDADYAMGPVPGFLIVPLTGVQVQFGDLDTPRLCWLENTGREDGSTSEGDYVEVGIRDPGTNVFYPLLELKPGEGYPVMLSRNIEEEYTGTGSGTTGPGNYLWLKATGAAQGVQVKAYEGRQA